MHSTLEPFSTEERLEREFPGAYLLFSHSATETFWEDNSEYLRDSVARDHIIVFFGWNPKFGYTMPGNEASSGISVTAIGGEVEAAILSWKAFPGLANEPYYINELSDLGEEGIVEGISSVEELRDLMTKVQEISDERNL